MKEQLGVDLSVSALKQPAEVGARDPTKLRGNALRHLPVRRKNRAMSFLTKKNNFVYFVKALHFTINRNTVMVKKIISQSKLMYYLQQGPHKLSSLK